MALVGECVDSEPSSFKEAVQQLVWVDAMVQEYDSIMRNCVWDVVKSLGQVSGEFHMALQGKVGR